MSWAIDEHIGELRPWPKAVRVHRADDFLDYLPERTCVPTKQHVMVSCSQERVTYLCDCGEVLGGYEMNTIPWTHVSDERELSNYCPKCGARIEVEE